MKWKITLGNVLAILTAVVAAIIAVLFRVLGSKGSNVPLASTTKVPAPEEITQTKAAADATLAQKQTQATLDTQDKSAQKVENDFNKDFGG